MTERRTLPNVVAAAESRIAKAGDESRSGLAQLVEKAGHQTRSKPTISHPGYHPQIAPEPEAPRPKRNPKVKAEKRVHVINMRLTTTERERFYTWCEERDLSLPDGLVALMDAIQGRSTNDQD